MREARASMWQAKARSWRHHFCLAIIAKFVAAALFLYGQQVQSVTLDLQSIAREIDPVALTALTEKNFEVAMPRLLKQALKGNIYAMHFLAFSYEHIDEPKQNYAEAAKWYRKAADKGLVDSMTSVAQAYSSGRGVPKSEAEAMKWLQKAAALGDASAMYSIGSSYSLANGVDRNPKEAVKWFEKCAFKGHGGCMYSLALQYERGEIPGMTRVHAYAWYNLAASSTPTIFAGPAAKSRTDAERQLTKEELTQAQALSVQFAQAIKPRK